jgi:diketogulonate reductase-like aldo/keto reductase
MIATSTPGAQFIELQKDGLARSIGVSNFQPPHLERLISETGVTPSVNQVELHPHFQQPSLRQVHEQLGIVTEAWSPLGQGQALNDDAIERIAERHRVTRAQVVIRWHLQLGNVVIPKSVTPERIRENIDVFGFELDQDDMSAIEKLDVMERFGPAKVIAAGALLLSLSCAGLLGTGAHTSYVAIVIQLAGIGFGGGLIVPVVTPEMLGDAER